MRNTAAPEPSGAAFSYATRITRVFLIPYYYLYFHLRTPDWSRPLFRNHRQNHILLQNDVDILPELCHPIENLRPFYPTKTIMEYTPDAVPILLSISPEEKKSFLSSCPTTTVIVFSVTSVIGKRSIPDISYYTELKNARVKRVTCKQGPEQVYIIV